ncbi:MAG: bifunctional oligoribonuclease/PAP phosphatase NrnA [Clostridia bacterium]|nr:bifunctional oligoribonuclease/PAP phosphatase NrnA [Clostridia bacterium]
MIINKIISILKEAGSIAILPHVSADGDALGSSFALALALQKMGKNVKVYIEEEVPYIYGFLPGKDFSEVYRGDKEHFDVVVALDTGDMDRLGKRREIFSRAEKTVNIDHHTTNSMFALVNYVNTSSSAVGEIIYQLIKDMGVDLDEEISLDLYVAIATDTGGFRYSNTTSLTHQISAHLVGNGVNVSEVSQKVFETTSFEKLKLMSLAIDSIELLENGKVAFMAVTDEMIKKSGVREEDCDIIGLARNIRGVEVAVMIRQKLNGEVKVNLRSNTHIDVSAIAMKHSGGGHKKAAGFSKAASMEAVKEMIMNDIREVL